MREDAAGDGVVPNGGETLPEVTGMDLTAVKLDIQGGAEVYDFPSSVTDLQITYEATEPIPASLPEGATGVWATDIYLGDTMVHRLIAKLTGSEWTVSIAGAEGDTATPEASPSPATKEPQPEVAGNRLIVHFPVTQLNKDLYRPGISFDWVSVTELDGTEVDRVPDTGRASFPSVIPTGDDR